MRSNVAEKEITEEVKVDPSEAELALLAAVRGLQEAEQNWTKVRQTKERQLEFIADVLEAFSERRK
jgi:hypothetical protein